MAVSYTKTFADGIEAALREALKKPVDEKNLLYMLKLYEVNEDRNDQVFQELKVMVAIKLSLQAQEQERYDQLYIIHLFKTFWMRKDSFLFRHGITIVYEKLNREKVSWK